MSNGGDACSLICGGCCIVLFSGLTAFCGTKTYGAGTGSAGCCTSCCRHSFDEDAFDAQVKQDLEKTRDPNAQPKPTAQMSPDSSAKVPPQAEGATPEETSGQNE
ncbi:hypothetical protein BJ912DRAFT_635726 [Pholiota molesta]|nr:hypothetical protein BJ912DRAFT_635726 [Pholiota molesta]